MKLDFINRAQATLAFLLSNAFNELLDPKMIVIEHSFGDGLFCHEANWDFITEAEIESVFQLMQKWINNGQELQFEEISKEAAIEEFEKINSRSKAAIAKKWVNNSLPIVRFGDHWDYRIELMIGDLKKLPPFQLRKYNDGFLMRLPTINHHDKIDF